MIASRDAVSVVIPTYNRVHLIRRAVDSALSQCTEADEVIVVDDGSADGTADILTQYAGRIQYLKLPHAGAGRARNAGIQAAKNPLIAFLDSDDEWLPGKLELQRTVLAARPDVLFSFSDFKGYNSDNQLTHHLLRTWHCDLRSWDQILGVGISYSSIAALPPEYPDFRVHIGDLSLPEMQSAYIATTTLVARRQQAGEALHFAEDVATYEDLECFGRLALLGRAAYLDCETACNYGHEGPRLSSAHGLIKATSRLNILERVWGTNAGFLSRYSREYETVITEARISLATAYLLQGNHRKAHGELSKLQGRAPWRHVIAAALPASLLHVLLILRETFLP